MFHVALPLAAYAMLALSSFAHARTREALFAVGAATLILLFSSVHNAWDAVAYHVLVNRRDRNAETRPDDSSTKEKP